MNRDIKISVIVPVYNVEKYIRQCLESIVNQTYRNLEVIVVNDGTKDNSMEIIEEFSSDKRIKVINKENGGIASARNRGIDEATGDYISFIDSDDWIELNTYKKLVEIIDDEDIITFNYNRIDNETQKIIRKNYLKMEEVLKLPKEYVYLYSELEDMCCIKLYKTEYIKENNFKFLEILHEDFWWKVETTYKTFKIKGIDDSFYNYRINRKDNRMSLEKNIDEKILKYKENSYKILLNNMKQFIKQYNDFSLGKLIYLNLEMENWRVKLYGDFYFEDIDSLLKKYLSKKNNNLIEKKIIIKKIKGLLKSRDTKKIIGLSYFEKIYWKNGIFDLDFVRKRLKRYIKVKR